MDLPGSRERGRRTRTGPDLRGGPTTPPIVTFACRDLGTEADDLRFWQDDSLEQFQTLDDVGDYSWIPDAVFGVYDKTAGETIKSERRDSDTRKTRDDWWREREERALRRVYPVEVKHDDASFGRDQCQAMNSLTALNDERVVPLLVRVTLDDLPQHYDVQIRTGPFGDES